MNTDGQSMNEKTVIKRMQSAELVWPGRINSDGKKQRIKLVRSKRRETQ